MMPRSIIHLIGALVTAAVLALGVALVAMPLGFQALGVLGQTATVANTNALYQAQVDHLRDEEGRLDQIQASVTALQAQITPAPELDDVFEVVAMAADASDVSITSVAAGEAASFTTRTSPTTLDEAATAAVEAPAADDAASTDSTETAVESAAPTAEVTTAAAGRTQVDFTINVSASKFRDVVEFLDGLRAHPRLVGAVESHVIPTGSGFDVTVRALTFVLPVEG
jgi:hypothetical protein